VGRNGAVVSRSVDSLLSDSVTGTVKTHVMSNPGFPPFKASQFQDLFKTFSRLNYLKIKTQLIRFEQILMKHQVAGKPTKEVGMMCLWLLNDHSGTFFNQMAIFKTFSRLYQRNHRIPNLFKALDLFSEFKNFCRFFQTVGTLVTMVMEMLLIAT
jgi:hypothetical protein